MESLTRVIRQALPAVIQDGATAGQLATRLVDGGHVPATADRPRLLRAVRRVLAGDAMNTDCGRVRRYHHVRISDQ